MAATIRFAGEIRLGEVAVEIQPDELPFPIEIGEIEITECQMVNSFKGSKTKPAQFTRGYGLTFGHGERKAMSMALVDRALRCRELDEEPSQPGAGRGIRALSLRQSRGLRLRAASEAAALRRFPVRAGDGARDARPAGARMKEAAE